MNQSAQFTSLSLLLLLCSVFFLQTTHANVYQDIEKNTRPIKDSIAPKFDDFLKKYLQLQYNGKDPANPITKPTPNLLSSSIPQLEASLGNAREKASQSVQIDVDGLLRKSASGWSSPKFQHEFSGIYPLNNSSSSDNYWGSSNNNSTQMAGNESLNADVLLNTSRIGGAIGDEKEKRAARAIQNFIWLASGMGTQLTIKRDKGSMSDDEYHEHLMTNWGMIAKQSLALSNFYYIMKRRTLIKDLGKAFSMPRDDASPHEVINHLTNRRVLNKQWYESMEVAPPITIARETLYVAAENQRMLNDLVELEERSVLTLSALVAQLNDNLRMGMKLQQQAAGSATGVEFPEPP